GPIALQLLLEAGALHVARDLEAVARILVLTARTPVAPSSVGRGVAGWRPAFAAARLRRGCAILPVRFGAAALPLGLRPAFAAARLRRGASTFRVRLGSTIFPVRFGAAALPLGLRPAFAAARLRRGAAIPPLRLRSTIFPVGFWTAGSIA